LLLDRNELTSGSTWHAAGNVPSFSASWNILKLQYYSTQLYKEMAVDEAYPINYHITGSIRLAHSEARMEEFAHVKGMAEYQGIVGYELLDNAQMEEYYPGLQTHDLCGGLWDPHDGDIDPSQLTQAFCSHARTMGAKIERFCPVDAITQRLDGKWVLSTPKGEVVAKTVINAAGYRGAEVAALIGQHLPIVSMQHQYLVTETIDSLDVDNKLPLLRDPDDSYYLRQERDGLLLGPYEWKATPEWPDGIPDNFAMDLYEDDLDRLEWYIESACARVPLLGTVGVQRVINGPIPYAPDGLPLMGPAYGHDNFYHCCSYSFGIAQAGGSGKIMAEWVLDGCPKWD
ncbi:MAG: FAD-binding oxidoreductase, partial [Pseudomonadota bacterium]